MVSDRGVSVPHGREDQTLRWMERTCAGISDFADVRHPSNGVSGPPALTSDKSLSVKHLRRLSGPKHGQIGHRKHPPEPIGVGSLSSSSHRDRSRSRCARLGWRVGGGREAQPEGRGCILRPGASAVPTRQGPTPW
jgi:hypothetical protein